MITFVIIAVFLIESCYCGSSGSSNPECNKKKSFIEKLWSIFESFISFICFLNGIWNTIKDWNSFFNNTTTGASG
ncbi:unnamed protein product [Schistosoma bovis]|nr:unnamed protein product [Schistosoma bovis]